MALKSYTRVAPPIPDWKFGEPVDSTESGRQYLAGAQGGFQVFESTDENALWVALRVVEYSTCAP
jgi:hypothetical protein